MKHVHCAKSQVFSFWRPFMNGIEVLHSSYSLMDFIDTIYLCCYYYSWVHVFPFLFLFLVCYFFLWFVYVLYTLMIFNKFQFRIKKKREGKACLLKPRNMQTSCGMILHCRRQGWHPGYTFNHTRTAIYDLWLQKWDIHFHQIPFCFFHSLDFT